MEYQFKNSREARKELEELGFYIGREYAGGVFPIDPPKYYPRIGREPCPVAYLNNKGHLTFVNTGKRYVNQMHKRIIEKIKI